MECKLIIHPRPQMRDYLVREELRACVVAHRRYGKTYGIVQDLFLRAATHRRSGPAKRYAYIAPTRLQAKDITWAYMKEFASQIPGCQIRESELRVVLPDNTTITLYSGENYERMRGLYFDGVVIDEMADIDPRAWTQVILPCLTDYNGWATFIGTPKGRNAFYKLYKKAEGSDKWFNLFLPANETGVFTDEELKEIEDQMPPEDFRQEYLCDWNVGRPGAVYADYISRARLEGRILPFNQDGGSLVNTSWDLGNPENTVVVYWQSIGLSHRVIDCDHGLRMETAERVAHMLSKGYNYGNHFLPHDSKKVEYDAADFATKLQRAGLRGIRAVPKTSRRAVENRIQVMSDLFANIHFNAATTDDEGGLLDALANYHWKQETKGEWITNKINEDWSAHFADAFGTYGEAIQKKMVLEARPTLSLQPAAEMPHRGKGVRQTQRQTSASM